MQIGTWIMLFVSIAWLALFVVFTVKDLREEGKKSAILDSGQPLDPFKRRVWKPRRCMQRIP